MNTSLLAPVSKDFDELRSAAKKEWNDMLAASQTFNVAFLQFLSTVRRSIAVARGMRVVTNCQWGAAMFPYLREVNCLTRAGWSSFVQMADVCHFLSTLLSSDTVSKLLAISNVKTIFGKSKKHLYMEMHGLLERLVSEQALERTSSVTQALNYLRVHHGTVAAIKELEQAPGNFNELAASSVCHACVVLILAFFFH